MTHPTKVTGLENDRAKMERWIKRTRLLLCRNPEKDTKDFRDLSTLQRTTGEHHAAGLPLRPRGLSGAQESGLAGQAAGQGRRVRIYHPYY